MFRIARGLYRYGPTGTIYLCRKHGGKNLWRNLRTTDRRLAVRIAALNPFGTGQDDLSAIKVLGEGQPRALSELTERLAERTSLPPARVAAPPQPPRPVVSLNDLVERFQAQSQHLAENTRSTMGFHFKVAAAHLDFSRDVTSITVSDVKVLKSRLAEERKGSTVNDILFKGLGGLFKIAVEDGLIAESPLVRLGRMKKKEPDRAQPTFKQGLALVDKIISRSEESGLIVSFMLAFGVGQAEIQNLDGGDIDLRRQVIRFRRRKTGKLFDVPIFPDVQPFLEELGGLGRLKRGQPVVQWRNPRKALAAACKEPGLPVFAPRALHRTFIVECLERGVDPRVVAKWQGHTDAKLIFNTYGKFISPEHERRQVEKMVATVQGEAEPVTE